MKQSQPITDGRSISPAIIQVNSPAIRHPMSGANKITRMKRELTAEEKAECAALKAIYASWKLETGKTQEFAADYLGYKTQGAVSQYLNARVALNLSAAAGFAKLLGCKVSDFSERLAKQLPEEEKAGYSVAEQRKGYVIGTLDGWDDDTPLEDDEVELPLFKEVEMAAGDGKQHSIEINGRKLRFSKATLRSAGVTPENAACATLRGSSMERLIMDGATIGIDRGRTQVKDGRIFALDHDGMLRVKYLYRQPGGGLRLRSENTEEYPDEFLTFEQTSKIKILGWVFWWSTINKW